MIAEKREILRVDTIRLEEMQSSDDDLLNFSGCSLFSDIMETDNLPQEVALDVALMTDAPGKHKYFY